MSTSASYFLPRPTAGTGTGIPRPYAKPRRWIHHGDENHFAGDYVVEFGDLKQDYGFTSKVVLALRTRLGSAQCAPWFGSRLHEIQTADERGRRLAESFTLMAIQHLRDEIQDLRVVASLVPGVILMPSGIFAVARAQEAGCHYMRSS